ncbi:MAG: NADH-quinone oxidoreductase subunit C, partial [Candidatus Methylomirabilis sp.]|nr:NADH-quinone oxidoreductase subunit C [Deltaproteobacteria bacterium]
MAKADLDAVRAEFGSAVLETSDFRGDETALVAPGKVHDVLAYLKRERGYDMCVDVCGVDYPERRDRLEVVWHLFAVRAKRRIRIKARVPAEE